LLRRMSECGELASEHVASRSFIKGLAFVLVPMAKR
jgi:hypothetical protein